MIIVKSMPLLADLDPATRSAWFDRLVAAASTKDADLARLAPEAAPAVFGTLARLDRPRARPLLAVWFADGGRWTQQKPDTALRLAREAMRREALEDALPLDHLPISWDRLTVMSQTWEALPLTAADLVTLANLWLDLGNVRELAEVRLNGRSLGVLWAPPWRVEITGAAKPGTNTLEIEVVNFWPNRIIGDQFLAPEKRFTRTNIRKLTRDTPLMESGLLGPVRVLAASGPRSEQGIEERRQR